MERGSSGRLPDFYVVGHPKSGTTALYAMLAQHPGIYLGAKEPRYFNPDLRERDLQRPGGSPKDLEEYRAWFSGAGPDQIVGDVSPEYLWSHDSGRLIAEVRPDARIVAILREPAAFLRSLHRQWLQHYIEVEPDFARALALEEPRREGRQIPRDTYWPKALFYTDQARYVEQLRRYESYFPREQMLVLIYDDYRANGEATVRQVLGFLGLDAAVPIVEREANPSVELRSSRLHGAMRAMLVSDSAPVRTLRGSVKALTPMRVRQRAIQAVRKQFVFGAPGASADEEFMTELRRRFAPEVQALSEHLGRDLVSLWGYDQLG